MNLHKCLQWQKPSLFRSIGGVRNTFFVYGIRTARQSSGTSDQSTLILRRTDRRSKTSGLEFCRTRRVVPGVTQKEMARSRPAGLWPRPRQTTGRYTDITALLLAPRMHHHYSIQYAAVRLYRCCCHDFVVAAPTCIAATHPPKTNTRPRLSRKLINIGCHDIINCCSQCGCSVILLLNFFARNRSVSLNVTSLCWWCLRYE